MHIEELNFSDYERVIHATDDISGLNCFVAIDSIKLGPALGGVRFWNYETDDDALNDVLRLARGMTYKNSLAELNDGGGKAVAGAGDVIIFLDVVCGVNLVMYSRSLGIHPTSSAVI